MANGFSLRPKKLVYIIDELSGRTGGNGRWLGPAILPDLVGLQASRPAERGYAELVADLVNRLVKLGAGLFLNVGEQILLTLTGKVGATHPQQPNALAGLFCLPCCSCLVVSPT